MSIHTCSYYCDRHECIKAQRDELRQKIEQAESLDKLVTENQRLGLYEPPKKQWVGFTHEELAWLNEALNLGGRFAVIEAIEAKLKEKNHDTR
jgi:hypothetical protein